MAEPFRHSLRVRFGECDPQGVVFNANYLAYLDTNLMELWRAAFGGYQVLLDRGIDMVVVEAGLRFCAPARFDEQLALQTGVTRVGHTSISTEHQIVRGKELIAHGTIHYVTVDRTALTKTAVPDWVRSALAPWTLPAGAKRSSSFLSPGKTAA